MAETARILFANEAFYAAFATRDLAAMDQQWATAAPVVCIHPGWDAITDRDSIMASWQVIFANPDPPAIELRDPEVHAHGELALVTCHEILQPSYLVAANAFVLENGDWKMVHHQASPVARRPRPTADQPEAVRH